MLLPKRYKLNKSHRRTFRSEGPWWHARQVFSQQLQRTIRLTNGLFVLYDDTMYIRAQV